MNVARTATAGNDCGGSNDLIRVGLMRRFWNGWQRVREHSCLFHLEGTGRTDEGLRTPSMGVQLVLNVVRIIISCAVIWLDGDVFNLPAKHLPRLSQSEHARLLYTPTLLLLFFEREYCFAQTDRI
jgi:hypothetical protein